MLADQVCDDDEDNERRDTPRDDPAIEFGSGACLLLHNLRIKVVTLPKKNDCYGT